MTAEARSIKKIHWFSLLVAVSLGACTPEPSDNRPLPERLRDMNADLTIGYAGNEVRALHDYLIQYGYLPNAELAKRFPRWRPAVSNTPANETTFDERTAEAVRRLQINAGLGPTGIVDAATRELLRRPRCGVPDTMIAFDPTDKFAPLGNANIMFANNWYLNGTTFGNLDATQVRTAMRGAAITWMRQTSLTIAEATDFGSRIPITFADLGPPTGTLGDTDPGVGNNPIRFNNRVNWSTASPTPANSQDFETVALHELGHALGLDHSAFNDALMYPFAAVNMRFLAPDDNVGISATWDAYWQLPGAAIDIAAGSAPMGSVWILGTDQRPYKWNGTNWDLDASRSGFVRIAVAPSDIPWAVASDNTIWRRSDPFFSSGDWQQKPGAATDIGIGNDSGPMSPEGGVWVVGTDHRVYKWNGTDFGIGINAAAKRIAVSPTGKPWIITTSNEIQNLTTNDTTGIWQTVPSLGDDIGVGPASSGPTRGQDGAAFKTDRGNLLVWNEQTGFTQDDTGAPSAASWRVAGFDRGTVPSPDPIDPKALPVGPIAISVGQNGKPWVIGTNGAIYTTIR